MSAEELKKQLAEKKEKMSEKLKYVLSNKDTYDPYEGQKKLMMSQKIIIPAKFTAHDKILRFGGKIEDPFKLNVINRHEASERVFTSLEHQKDPSKRVTAIKHIEDTFERVKSIKVGMEKPGTNGRVTAKKVHSLIPHF